MRIANIMISKIQGGVEQAFLDYNEALLYAGHEVLAVTAAKAAVIAELARTHGANLRTSSFSFSRLNCFLSAKLYRCLADFSPDIIITHSKKIIPLLRRLADRLGVPLVAVAHNAKYKLIDRADAIFSITAAQCSVFIAGGYPEDKIFVVPNLNKSKKLFVARRPHNPPVIGTMGRFDPMKDFQTYISALGELRRRGLAFKAVLGGAAQKTYPAEADAIKERIREEKLENVVELSGWIMDKDDFFNRIDIFVLPSKEEPFGIVLLEAAQASVPIVCSDASGPTEIFSGAEKEVLFFPRGDKKALADKLAAILQDYPAAIFRAEAAWRLCRDKYSLPAVAAVLDEAVHRVCAADSGDKAVVKALSQILPHKIVGAKRFGRGHHPVMYVRLADGTELTAKFYDKEEDLLAARRITEALGKNKDLPVPRLYPLPVPYFRVGNLYGLCFFYIPGREIKTRELRGGVYCRLISMYAAFQQTPLPEDALPVERDLSEYLKEAGDLCATIRQNSPTYLQRLSVTEAEKLIKLLQPEIAAASQIRIRPIHNDLSKSNLLFDKGEFVSFLDTDSICLSCIGRDFAEFIISSVLRYPLFRPRLSDIDAWYRAVDEEFSLPLAEYRYGLALYYASRLTARLKQYQKKQTFCKYLNMRRFARLYPVTLAILAKIKQCP